MVYVFLKNDKRGGSNKHGSNFVNLVKIKVKSFKNSKVNAQKWNLFANYLMRKDGWTEN